MSIGILYESVEWSNHQLALHLNNLGIKTELINLETDQINIDSILKNIQHQNSAAFFSCLKRYYYLICKNY